MPDSTLFTDISRDVLQRGLAVRFTATGESMKPFIKNGETITVLPVDCAGVKKGDILVYALGNTVTVHCVAKVLKCVSRSPVFILRGDLMSSDDEYVQCEQVLGRVQSVERKGRAVTLNSWYARCVRFTYALAYKLKTLGHTVRVDNFS